MWDYSSDPTNIFCVDTSVMSNRWSASDEDEVSPRMFARNRLYAVDGYHRQQPRGMNPWRNHAMAGRTGDDSAFQSASKGAASKGSWESIPQPEANELYRPPPEQEPVPDLTPDSSRTFELFRMMERDGWNAPMVPLEVREDLNDPEFADLKDELVDSWTHNGPDIQSILDRLNVARSLPERTQNTLLWLTLFLRGVFYVAILAYFASQQAYDGPGAVQTHMAYPAHFEAPLSVEVEEPWEDEGVIGRDGSYLSTTRAPYDFHEDGAYYRSDEGSSDENSDETSDDPDEDSGLILPWMINNLRFNEPRHVSKN